MAGVPAVQAYEEDMSTESRRRTWLVYDAKRKATAERKLKERARTIVRGMMLRAPAADRVAPS